MRRWLGWIAIGWLLLLCTLALVAYGAQPSRLSLSDRTRAVAVTLRCPVCQGESVADSPSGIAASMRTVIRKRLAAGQSSDQIKRYFVSTYGNWILLAPPTSGVGSAAWFIPPLMILGGIGLLVTLVTDWRTQGRRRIARPEAAYLDRVRAEWTSRSGLE